MTNPSQSNGAYIVGYIENEFTKPSNQICQNMYTYDTHTQVVTNVFGLNKSLLLSIDKDWYQQLRNVGLIVKVTPMHKTQPA